MSGQYRNVFITLNNYTEEEYNTLKDIDCKYMVLCKEVGKKRGVPHLHGYYEFKSPKEFSTLKKINGRMDIERRKKTALHAANYCKKEGNYVEFGTISQQGKRTDLEEVCELILEKKPMKEVANYNPSVFVKYHKGLLAFKNIQFTDRTSKPEVHWRWGLAGVGKTRYCVETHPNHYIKDGTMWWDGYEQEEAIIIDDFDGHWPYRDFLRLIDRQKYQGQYKGGYVKINSPFIYITCEHPPEHFWVGNELKQITRRLTSIQHIFLPTEATEVAGNIKQQLL